MSDLFYVFGIALTVGALLLSFIGLRSERFPASRGLYAVGIGVMGALVAASCAFAVVLAREEADHRAEEVAEFEAEQAAEEEEADPGAEPAPAEEPVETEPAQAETLQLTSPEDGSLVFDTSRLQANAGEVSIDYTNPSAVPHNVAIESGGEQLAQSETVTGGSSASASASLEPGNYTFYCSIPGHREAGMEGTLTVK